MHQATLLSHRILLLKCVESLGDRVLDVGYSGWLVVLEWTGDSWAQLFLHPGALLQWTQNVFSCQHWGWGLPWTCMSQQPGQLFWLASLKPHPWGIRETQAAGALHARTSPGTWGTTGFCSLRQDHAWLVPWCFWCFYSLERPTESSLEGFVTQVGCFSLCSSQASAGKENEGSFPQLSGLNKPATWPWCQVSYISPGCLPPWRGRGGRGAGKALLAFR